MQVSIGLTRADSFGDGISLRQLLYFEKEFDESKNLFQVKIGTTISPMNFNPPWMNVQQATGGLAIGWQTEEPSSVNQDQQWFQQKNIN